jgi:hypothetical protein
VESILVSVIVVGRVGLVGLLKVKALQEQQELIAALCRVDVDSNNIKIVLVVVINRQ